MSLPSLISWTRLPLAAAFPWAVAHPGWAAVVLLAAGVTDVLDGFVARRFGLVTATGAVLDGVTDKLFVAVVVVTLVTTGTLPLYATLLLGAREIGEAPLVVWYAVSERLRRGRIRAPMANVAGKAGTVLQFATVVLALFRSRFTEPVLWLTALVGAVAAASYALRALHAYRVGNEPAPPG